MPSKQQNWLEYGDVALHLVAAWPPDLAYLILYGFRELQSEIGYDPVTLVLKAVEMLPHLRCEGVALHLDPSDRVRQLRADPTERARSGAKILVREIVGVPLRWAQGIYRNLDPEMKPFVEEQLRAFSPTSARILMQAGPFWLFTGSGLRRVFFRLVKVIFGILFGKE